MSLFKRRLIYLSFILLFVTIAPLLILYANGYRVDWNQWSLYKTGLLVVEYLPKDATLTIDGVAKTTKSPTRVAGLAPRTYTLKIDKEGYYPWEKRLWIPEYTTTFVRHVTLFKKSQGTHIDITIDRFAPHPIEPVITVARVVAEGYRIERIDTRGVATAVPNLPAFASVDALRWSKNGVWLLVVGKSGGRTIARVAPFGDGIPVLALESLVTTPLTELTWDAANDDVLAGKGVIGRATWMYAMNVAARRIEQTLLPENTLGLPFIIDGKRLMILAAQKEKEATLIFRPFTPTTKTVEQRVTIPSAAPDLRLRASQDHLITLLDTKTRTAYLVEREPRTTTPLVETFSNVTGTAWSPNGRRLVYWNDQEIFLWDLERNTKERIHRSDDTIVNIFWHPENEYVFFQTKNALSVLEIDGRDHRNLVALTALQLVGDAAIDARGRWLVLWDTFSGTTGIEWFEIK